MLRFTLILLAFVSIARGQSYDELRRHIVSEEGYSSVPYLLRGHWHIGLGHKLTGQTVPRVLSKREIERLFAADLKTACDTVYWTTPHFSRHPKSVRIMLCALAYNVGSTGYLDFTRFRAAIDRRDYRAAARELSNSLWSRQLPDRAARYISALNSV